MTSTEDIPFREINGQTLLARLYRPAAGGPAKWLIDVHGGAWGSGDRLNNAVIHEDLAAHGIGVCALDFRASDTAQYPAPVDDVAYGVRWFKAHAATYGIETSLIGGLGSSSGGQQMGLVALHPNGPDWNSAEPSYGRADATLDFFIACWPILDPLARYRMAQETGKERLVAAHDAYFPSEDDMTAGNPYLLLERGDATHLPPMLIVQGTEDANVSHSWQDRFADLYRTKGGEAEMRKFPGQPHTFVTAEPEAEASKDAIREIREFVLAL